MNILSQLRNSVPGLPHSVQGLFRDDRLYRYLNVYPLKGLCKGRTDNHAERAPPIHTLPVELLAEIFRHYVQIVDYSQPSHSLSVQPYSQTTPFLLAEVCYYWRSVALSMGDLWQSMFIGPPKTEHIPLVRLWLSRAGEYPLSLWLFQSRYPSEAELQATNEILSLLIDRLHRWKSIEFRFSAGVHQPLLDIPHNAAVSLEAARIDARYWGQSNTDALWRALHSSPLLCRPDWVNHYWHGPPSHAPWAQLTYIRLEGLHSIDAVLNILFHCQRVTVLTLQLVPPDAPFQPRAFVLPELRTLTISTETELGSFFQSLILPRLVSLDIMHRLGVRMTRSSLPIADLICRSSCQLGKLALGVDEDDLFDYLRMQELQSITELQLYDQVTDKLVRMLSRQAESEQLLPLLQALTLRCRISDGVLSDMIASRMPTLRLVRATLRCEKDSYRQDRAMLEKIREEGCDVRVTIL